MNIDETKQILAVLETAYSDFYKNSTSKESVLKLWHMALREYSYQQCNNAILSLIKESPYTPKISDVITRIKPLQNALPEAKSKFDDRWMFDWYENHKASLHSMGLKTASEFKMAQCKYAKEHDLKLNDLTDDEWYELGLSYRNYNEQFVTI